MPMEAKGPFEINKRIHENDKNRITQIFYAISNLTEACILGIDFFINNKIKLDSLTRRISYNNNQDKFHIIGKIAKVKTPHSLKKEEKKDFTIEDEECEKYRGEIEKLLENNKDIIARTNAELGRAANVEHKIELEHERPIFLRYKNRKGHFQEKIIAEKVSEMLEFNII